MTTTSPLEPSTSKLKIKSPSKLIEKFFRKNNTHILAKKRLKLDIQFDDNKTKYIVSIDDGHQKFNTIELEKAGLFEFANEYMDKYLRATHYGLLFEINKETHSQLLKMDRIFLYDSQFIPLCLIKNLNLRWNIVEGYNISHKSFVCFNDKYLKYNEYGHDSPDTLSRGLIINLPENQQVSKQYFTKEKTIKELCLTHKIEYIKSVGIPDIEYTRRSSPCCYFSFVLMLLVFAAICILLGFMSGGGFDRTNIKNIESVATLNSTLNSYQLSHICENDNNICLLTRLSINLSNFATANIGGIIYLIPVLSCVVAAYLNTRHS